MRRLAGRAGLGTLASLLPWLLLALLALGLAGRLDLLQPMWAPALAGGVAVLLVAFLAAAIAGRPSRLGAALLLDRRLESREVVTAAVEAGPESGHPLARAARSRAEALLGSPDARRAFPLTTPRVWRPAALALVALLLHPLLPQLRSPDAAAQTAPPVVARTGEELAKALAELEGKLEKKTRPEEALAMERLREAADAMRSGETASIEEALLALERVEKAARAARTEAEAMARTSGLGALVDKLSADPFLGELGRALESGDQEALARALQAMSGAMSGEAAEKLSRGRELETLAARFEEMAALLRGSGEPELAETLMELAAAIRSGDLAKAREMLASFEVNNACQAAGQLAGGSLMARDLMELTQMARYLLGGGKPVKLGEGGPCDAQGRCRGAGAGPGTGTTNERGGEYQTGERIARDREADATSDMTAEHQALYGSRLVEADSWEDVQARGRLGEGGEVGTQVGLSFGIRGEATLPLQPLDAAVPGAAEGASELERVPPGYREIVRRYFTREVRPETEKPKEQKESP